MKNLVLGFLTTTAVLAIAAFGYLKLGLADVPADVDAPVWESELMNLAVQASVQRSAPKISNPLPATDENLIASGKLYLNGCAGCHGTPGKSRRNFPGFAPPPQLSQVETQYSEPELFWVIKHGVRRTGMSAYGAFYSDSQMWTLAAFVKRMSNLSPVVLDGIQPKKL